MNICFVLGNFDGKGGIGRVTSLIANSLANDDEYKIYTLSYFKRERFNKYVLNEKVNDFVLLEQFASMKKTLFFGGIGKVKAFIRKYKIDVIIACGAIFFPLCALAAKNENCKCICWEHSHGNNNHDHGFQMLCRRIGYFFSDAILNITKQDQDIYKKRFGEKLYFQIYNPIDERLKESNPKYDTKSHKIITVGRLCYQKNYPAVIEIAKKVLTYDNDWTWDIYGEGEERKEIEILIKDGGLKDRVFLKGQVPDLYDKYEKYAFLVMTSRYEGFGMTLIEALNKNLPVVAFDVECGPREIIRDGINGYLVPAFDQTLMTKRIKKLCDSAQLRKKLSEQTESTLEMFQMEEVIHQWKKMLNSICNT